MVVFIIFAIIALVFLEKFFKKNNKKRREYVKRTKDRGMDDYDDDLDDKTERAADVSKGYFGYKEFEVDKDLKKFEKKLKELKYLWTPLIIISGFFMPFIFAFAPFYLGTKYFIYKKRINKLKRRKIVLYNLKDD